MLWQDEEIRLYRLHYLMRVCQTIARTFGQSALEYEEKYNGYVQLLH